MHTIPHPYAVRRRLAPALFTTLALLVIGLPPALAAGPFSVKVRMEEAAQAPAMPTPVRVEVSNRRPPGSRDGTLTSFRQVIGEVTVEPSATAVVGDILASRLAQVVPPASAPLRYVADLERFEVTNTNTLTAFEVTARIDATLRTAGGSFPLSATQTERTAGLPGEAFVGRLVRAALAKLGEQAVEALRAAGPGALAGLAPEGAAAAGAQAPAGNATVLLRLSVRIDGTPHAPLVAPHDVALWIADASGGPMRPLAPRDVRPIGPPELGWVALDLPAGSWMLQVLPPGRRTSPPAVAYHVSSGTLGRFPQPAAARPGGLDAEAGIWRFAGSVPADFAPLPALRFRVPEGSRIVHAGEASVACTSTASLIGAAVTACEEVVFTREARDVGAAMRELAGREEPPPSVVFVAGGPLETDATLRAGLQAAPAGSRVGAVQGVTFGAGRASPVVVFVGTPSGGLLGLSALSLVVSPLAKIAGDAQAEQRAAQARPCIESLAAATPAPDPERVFAEAVSAHAGSGAPQRAATPSDRAPAAPGAVPADRPRVTAALSRLQLVEHASEPAVCLDLALRVSLDGPGVREYDARIAWGGPLPAHSALQGPWAAERRILSGVSCRPLPTWCGPQGAALLREDAQRGARAIAARFLQDLGIPTAD